ncbi:MAG: extensin family protein, partial [Pseudanabaena sp.]
MALKTFNSLSGVPTHYDRFEAPPAITYGTRGKLNKFSAEDNFVDKLDECFQELWNLCPLGRAEVITSAGAFVNRPRDPSDRHSEARAFDLDGIFWAGRNFVTLYDGYQGGDRKFYFGVNAVLCKHFGVVLNYLFNADHRDHFHLDDSRNVGFDPSASSKVLFLQGALVHVMGLSIGSSGIDGDFGPDTQAAFNAALAQFGITGIIITQIVWLAF